MRRDSRLVVTKSTTGTADQATKASWRVGDIADEVAQLQARGVQIQDLPARLYVVGPVTAPAITCWLAGKGRFSSSRTGGPVRRAGASPSGPAAARARPG